jgi:hypothetical protein
MTVPQTRPAAAPPLQVINGQAGRSRPRISHWAMFAVAVVAAFFGLIYSRISLDRSSFVIQDLEDQIAVQEELHWQLRYQLAEIQDPAKVEAAIADLGLVYPDQRVALSVPYAGDDQLQSDYRWAQLQAILSARP